MQRLRYHECVWTVSCASLRLMALAFDRSKAWDIESLTTQRDEAVRTLVRSGRSFKLFEYSVLSENINLFGSSIDKASARFRMCNERSPANSEVSCMTEMLRQGVASTDFEPALCVKDVRTDARWMHEHLAATGLAMFFWNQTSNIKHQTAQRIPDPP